MKDFSSVGADILQFSTQEHTTTVCGFAKVVVKQKVHIPARSVAMVVTTGWKTKCEGDTALVDPIDGPLTGGLLVENTVAKPSAGHMFTQVVNFKDEDVWLKPSTQIGVFHVTDHVQNRVSTIEISRVLVGMVKVSLRNTSSETQEPKYGSCPVDLSEANCSAQEKGKLWQLLILSIVMCSSRKAMNSAVLRV